MTEFPFKITSNSLTSDLTLLEYSTFSKIRHLALNFLFCMHYVCQFWLVCRFVCLVGTDYCCPIVQISNCWLAIAGNDKLPVAAGSQVTQTGRL